MRRYLPLLLLTACVTRVATTLVSFPARPDWEPCVRERLGMLGYSVGPLDSAGVAATRAPDVQLRVSAAPDTTLRVELARGLGRGDVDSLVVYCGAGR